MTKLTSLSLGLVGFALSACPAFAQPSGNPGFDRMKTLVGEWSGQTANGKAVQVSYRLVSSGTALLETLEPADEPEMVVPVLIADQGGRSSRWERRRADPRPRP